MWFDNRTIQEQLWPATLETLYTTFFATLFTVIIGLAVGVAVVATSPRGLAPSPWLNRLLGVIINVGRSIPYIILAILLIPLTRVVVGNAIGWPAAVFSLTLAAIPFFARLVETNLLQVDSGKIEAARMMGATRTRIMFDVVVREALPALVQSATVLVITLISYGAMAGAIGGGGLGQLAMNHGYQRYQIDVMVITVVVIVLIVQAVQMSGDMLSRLVDHR
ncbi:D-methionine transport system permease protein [Ruaniaceae bacterium KH17]|nr:D-methionine transport system permease protein [Ruaniaceae bacterium KH17]